MWLWREAGKVILPAFPALGRLQQVPADKKQVSKELPKSPAREEGLENACRHQGRHIPFQPRFRLFPLVGHDKKLKTAVFPALSVPVLRKLQQSPWPRSIFSYHHLRAKTFKEQK